MAQSGKPHGWIRDGVESHINLNDWAVRSTWPTPTAQDGKNNAPPSQWERNSAALNVAVQFPTIGCKTMGGASGSYAKLQALAEDGVITEDERRNMASGSGGQLNPDWVEGLMCWPVGWTDPDTPNHRVTWLHPSFDPAEADSPFPYIQRVTSRRQYRAARIRAIGNGQYPPTAYIMAEWGRALLEEVARC